MGYRKGLQTWLGRAAIVWKELKNKKATQWVALKSLNSLSATLAKY
jgi:hypothetical protein